MRTVIAAGVFLLAAACTQASPGTAGTGKQPSSRPAQTVTGSAGPSQAPSGTASGAPAVPLGSVPVRAVPACARATCQATVVVPDARPGIDLAVVRGPDRDVWQTAYLLTLDTAARPLDSRPLTHGDVFFDPALPVTHCDEYVHCFVAAGVGAHGSVMNIVAVGPTGQLTDVSQGGELATDTPDIAARDLDGDGIAEVFGVENDYQPNYAEGSRFWLVWSWQGGRYMQDGCRVALQGEQTPPGPVTPAACPT